MLLVWVVLSLFIVASLVATIVLYAAVVTSARTSAEMEYHESTPDTRRTQTVDTPREVRKAPQPPRQTGEWVQPQ